MISQQMDLLTPISSYFHHISLIHVKQLYYEIIPKFDRQHQFKYMDFKNSSLLFDNTFFSKNIFII